MKKRAISSSVSARARPSAGQSSTLPKRRYRSATNTPVLAGRFASPK